MLGAQVVGSDPELLHPKIVLGSDEAVDDLLATLNRLSDLKVYLLRRETSFLELLDCGNEPVIETTQLFA